MAVILPLDNYYFNSTLPDLLLTVLTSLALPGVIFTQLYLESFIRNRILLGP